MDKTIDHRLAWLAGIIDGEGTIGFAVRSNIRKGRCGPYSSIDWYVHVGNTDPAMLNEIMALCDILGCHYSLFTVPAPPHYKIQRRVSVNSKRGVRDLIVAVLPYLITKRARAELVLRAMAHRYGTASLTTRTKGDIPVHSDAALLGMVAEMKSLNALGTKEE